MGNKNEDVNAADLTKQIQKLELQIGKLSNHYSTINMFFGGMLRGAGIIVGATLLVLVGSALLNLLGLLPGLEDVVKVIVEAFDKARVQ